MIETDNFLAVLRTLKDAFEDGSLWTEEKLQGTLEDLNEIVSRAIYDCYRKEAKNG